MTDRAIKAALEAAGEAARKAMIRPGSCMEEAACALPCCRCGSDAASAAIAEFLRALPDESGVNIAAPSGDDDWFEKDRLAAAVETAAKGEA